MKTREVIQQEAKSAIIKSLDETSKAAVNMSVGVGKSRICLDILNHYKPDKITWLTVSETLRDEDTPKEFIKWEYEYLLAQTSVMCYQSAYKLKDEYLGFVVCDEVDFILDSEEYIKAITQNRIDKLLVVSGTYTEDKLAKLESLDIPLVYSISTSEAQELGILNKTKITFIEFPLSLEKNIKVETKYKSWMSSENELYLYQENQFISTIIAYEKLKKGCDEHYRGIKPIIGFNYEKFKQDKLAYQKKLKWIASARAKVLHTLDSSKKIARKLSNQILQESNNKVVVFSALTEHLDSFIPNTLHSKNKKGSIVLEQFNSGIIRELGACSVLDRGINMIGLNNSIFESYNGSSTKGTQRQGRNLRLDSNDTAYIYVLIPYYMNKQGKLLPTRALSWAYKMFENYILDESNSLTININEL